MLFGCLFIYLSGIKTVYPYTLKVRLISNLGKNTAIDNNFFSYFYFGKQLINGCLRIKAGFLAR